MNRLGIMIVCLTPGLFHCGDRAEHAPQRSERLDQQCKFARGTLLDIRTRLRSSDLVEQRLGEDGFRLQTSEWRALEECGGVPVGGTCSPGDRACMLHVTDWALVVVR